jgi:hypothetical protein
LIKVRALLVGVSLDRRKNEMKYVSPQPLSGATRTRAIFDGELPIGRQSVYPVYIPAECWDILKELSREQGRSKSQIIESLILPVARGKRRNHRLD